MNTNHYPDIERCKKLTEIGFPETELWYSNATIGVCFPREHRVETPYIDENIIMYPQRKYDIPTKEVIEERSEDWTGWATYHDKMKAEEVWISVCPSVMEMLDVIRKVDWNIFEIHPHGYEDHAWIEFELDDEETTIGENIDITLPNALADLIFWLHENNYIKF